MFRSLILGLLFCVALQAQEFSQWEADIAAFEKQDQMGVLKGGVLFVGSSSIRLWESLPQDFPNSPLRNRGFGGSRMMDVVHFFDRLIQPHAPQCVVLFAGTNDIAGGRTAEQVAADFKAFTEKFRRALPECPLVYISITSSPARWEQRDIVVDANRRIQEIAMRTSKCNFVPFREQLLAPNGQPRVELFQSDRLHLNEKGYAMLAEAIRPLLPR